MLNLFPLTEVDDYFPSPTRRKEWTYLLAVSLQQRKPTLATLASDRSIR